MATPGKDSLDGFLSFLYESGSARPEQMRADLASMGVNVERLNGAVSAMLRKAERADNLAWLERAKRKREAFESKIIAATDNMVRKFGNSRELLQAALNGQLGGGLQTQAQVFFRNRDLKEFSDKDLRSVVADFELLELLEENDKKDS